MNKVKFGTSQVGNPTPASLERKAKIFIGVSGLILAWMPTNNLVPLHIQEIITPVTNLFNSVIIFLLPYFGVQVDRKTVPVDDVASMETKPSADK